MRQPSVALAVAVICVLVAGCGSTIGNAESTTTTRSMIRVPSLSVNWPGCCSAPTGERRYGDGGMTVTNNQASMSDNSATMAPQACLAIDGAAEAPVYANSDDWAERDQSLNDGDNFTHYLKQAVVLFLIIETAGAFFDRLCPAVASLPRIHPHAERVAVVRRADLQR